MEKKQKYIIAVFIGMLVITLLLWSNERAEREQLAERYEHDAKTDYQGKFINLVSHFSMLVDVTEAYEENGSDNEELFKIALNNQSRSLDIAISNLRSAAYRMENETPLSEIIQQYYLDSFLRDLKSRLDYKGNINKAGQILESYSEELSELVWQDHEDFMENESQLRIKEILEDMRSEFQTSPLGD